MGEFCYTYCRFSDDLRYKAFDLNAGCAVGRLIHCTIIQDSAENRAKLQELADLNSEDGLQIQLRTDSGKVVFTTSLN